MASGMRFLKIMVEEISGQYLSWQFVIFACQLKVCKLNQVTKTISNIK